ncbi:MAG: DUF2804 domain-containing protein [Caldisericaceae bacterium]
MKEITESINLCDENGNLNPLAIGWSRRPLHDCNLSGHFFRKKRWNYWAVYDRNLLFSATISDVDYLKEMFCYYIDFETKDYYEKTFIMPPFSKGIRLGQSISEEATFNSGDSIVRFSKTNEGMHIDVELPKTPKGRINANIVVFDEGSESLNVVIPWSRRLFQYTSKQFCLRAEGEVSIGGNKHTFSRKEAFATLDFGRGAWKYSTFWNWGSFSAKLADGKIVGLNAGGGWTDGTGMNENGLLIDGKLSKIFQDVIFDYDRADFMKPWHLYTKSSDMVDIVLKPFFERKAKTNMLIVSSQFHQMFGAISGTLKDDSNHKYEINDAIGWVEEHNARW